MTVLATHINYIVPRSLHIFTQWRGSRALSYIPRVERNFAKKIFLKEENIYKEFLAQFTVLVHARAHVE